VDEEEAPAATTAAAATVIDPAVAVDTIVQQPTVPEAEPVTPSRRRRNRRAGNPEDEGTVQAQAGLTNQRQPSPVTLVTCRLDANGNVAGLVLAKADASNWRSTCATGTTTNIQLDFQDTQILQVSIHHSVGRYTFGASHLRGSPKVELSTCPVAEILLIWLDSQTL
jgi:hypothetical protein